MNDMRIRMSANESCDTSSEAFVVESKTLFFLAMVYQDHKKYYHGKGSVLFSTGEHLGFATASEQQSVVLNRCNRVAEQLAVRSRGTMERGRIDEKGIFHSHRIVTADENNMRGCK